MRTLGLEGARVLVTGVSGIGRAVVVAALEEGAQVGVVSRRPEPLDALLAETAGTRVCVGAVADVTDAAALG